MKAEQTEAWLRCVHVAALIAVQGIALVVLWHYYEREIRQAWAEAQRQANELAERLTPRPLTGQMWDDIAEAMQNA